MKPVFYNSKGQPIVLNEREQMVANNLEKKANDLGFEIDVTSLTTIVAQVSEQKFFEIAPATQLPVVVGQGAWSQVITTYRSYDLGQKFSTGILNTGGNNTRLAVADAGVDAVNLNVFNWAKGIGWTLIDLAQASKAGNWDLVTAKEVARKKGYDLGIQEIAFLGSTDIVGCEGLLNVSGITNNTTVIPQPISTLSPVDLKQFLTVLLDTYRSNAQRTAWPTHFIIPESDYLGLAAPSSAEFPIQSVLEQMEKALKVMTKNPNFQILPNAYCDGAHNSLGFNRYIMLNYDPLSLNMQIPVPYTNTLANSIDNFAFQNAAYSQFTGVQAIRPREMLYFQSPTPS